MKIKIGESASKNVCKKCRFYYRKMNREPCISCTLVKDENIKYRNYVERRQEGEVNES